ncbi:alpha/beta hydrolase [Pseudosulfitobacter koreensis]|uniref:Lysophospholipase n=1 Tax=Pseudosulfitobacter koreensis TaxID=2968472 RepID=A0ABT1Z4A6_9RHOB|nr:lysophospholipase [Pseudosulfitobacter koreense]
MTWRDAGAWFLVALATLFALIVAFGPREPAPLDMYFDKGQFDGGVAAHFARTEARFDDITEGVEKRVIWAGASEQKTEWSVLYVHGFSATSEEIRPVPDRVADALGANLVYTRLQGHGRDSAAMGTASVAGWMADMAEGLAAAQAVGDKVILIGTSTGATLITAAVASPAHMDRVAGVVLVSPNFGVNNPYAAVLTWPLARTWAPWIAGDTIGFTPRNAAQERYWTTRYPSVAALPLGALVKAVNALEHDDFLVPALFWYSDADQVVDPQATDRVRRQWGAGWGTVATRAFPDLQQGDDPAAHVVAGEIMSPSQTELIVSGILGWIREIE